MTHEEFDIRVVALRDKAYRFALRMTGDGAQAEDAVQDVMEKMWRGRSRLDGVSDVGAFVMRSVANRCRDLLRRRKARPSGELPGEAQAREEDYTGRRETMECIARAIAQLSGKQRMAIHLRDVEGYEFDEIARIMGCDTPSVRVYLSRARKTVSEKLKNFQEGAL